MPKGIYNRIKKWKLSNEQKWAISLRNKGDKHWNWKKDNITYIEIHSWNNKYYPKTKVCSKCEKFNTKTEWALVHGKKHSRGIENYMELCLRCHRKYDFEGRTIWNKGNVAVYPKKCEFCLQDFNGKKKSSRFCSNICSGKWRFREGKTKIIPGANEFTKLTLNKK
jgi:hypothetical protein